MNVKGLSIRDILDIDLDTFNNMSESDLRHITSRLVSASNKRIRRLKEHDINSPALRGMGDMESFSTKLDPNISNQQRVNQLRHTFAQMRSFLTSETSTISGYKKYSDRIMQGIAEKMNMSKKSLEEKLGKDGVNKLFDLHHWAQEKGYVSSYRGSDGSKQARNVIADILIDNPNASEEDIKRWFEETAEKVYEEEERKQLDKNDLKDETEESEFDNKSI